ncbi:RelA/SpoT family protein [Patescibacteria group bacterium]
MNRDLKSLLKRVKEYNDAVNEKRLVQAYEYAKNQYEGHMRLSGDPVIVHAVETAKILTTQKVDEDTLIAALLHEIPGYTKLTSKDISEKFGQKVGVLISAYEKMGVLKNAKEQSELETLRKMCLVMAKDLRVVLIKLADRLHNLQTLEALDNDERKTIAKETMDIFVPIASRLGIYRLRSILEDLCFKFLNEKEYKNIQDQLKVLGKKKKNVIDEIVQVVKDILKELKVEAKVSGRLKNTYSIYKKLKKKGKSSIDEIHDIFAIRILLPSKFKKGGEEMISHLYELIGHIHNKWKPIPGKFKDYVGFPKPNGYKSLHTTVIGIAPHSFKEPVEIQIRTENMHEEAEYGVASHWLYKEAKGNGAKLKSHVDWMKNLAKLSEGDVMINEIKVDIFEDRIFIFTPKGDVKDLPLGSTPIDFAYAVHTDVGDKCVMAKVNGEIMPLNNELKNGDVVEVITRSNSKPKLEWLSNIKTSSARNKIKSFFNSMDQDGNFRVGKEYVNKKLEKIGKPKLDPKLSILKNYSGQVLPYRKREELVRLVGSGTMLPSQLVWKVYDYNDVMGKSNRIRKEVKTKVLKTRVTKKGILVGDQKGLPIRLAKCCKPKYGQQIKAFVTRGSSLSIHKENCRVLKLSDSKRHMDAKWLDTL